MLITGSIVLLAVAVAGLIVRSVNSRRQSLIVAAAAAPVLTAAAVPALVLAALARAMVPAAVGVVVLGAVAAAQWPLYRERWRRRPVPDGRRMRIMQANIFVGAADPEALADQVRRLEIDVLTVCEVTPQGLQAILRSPLPRLLPYHYCSTGQVGDGTGIWSRHPLSDTSRHDGFVTELLSATIDLPDGTAPRVFAVHPVPPWPREPGDWLREMELLRQMLRKIPASDGTILVAGDFNATADHRPYRALLDGCYQDAAIAAG
ncbi:MAG: endonuclease/exonuclease/phosphatase family protein, partial [Nocardia sp.]|nr:endonuclease/exonuclease/phosphatase family protein [Nocardia sp.]